MLGPPLALQYSLRKVSKRSSHWGVDNCISMVSSHVSPLYNWELLKSRSHVLFMIIFRTFLVLRLGYHYYLDNSAKRILYHEAEQLPPTLLSTFQLFSKLCSGIWRNRKGKNKIEKIGWWWGNENGWLNKHSARRKHARDVWVRFFFCHSGIGERVFEKQGGW